MTGLAHSDKIKTASKQHTVPESDDPNETLDLDLLPFVFLPLILLVRRQLPLNAPPKNDPSLLATSQLVAAGLRPDSESPGCCADEERLVDRERRGGHLERRREPDGGAEGDTLGVRSGGGCEGGV